jgi:hypothetical protein
MVLETTADKVRIINVMKTDKRKFTNTAPGTLPISNCLIL